MNSKKSILAMGLMTTILGGGVSSATEERVQMGETQNLWEEEAPIARNVTDIQALAEHADQLKGKVVTIEGIEKLNSAVRQGLHVLDGGRPLRIAVSNCSLSHRDLYTIAGLECREIAIVGCGLTGIDGLALLGYLTPFHDVKLDLSDNKLSQEKGQEFLDLVKSDVRNGLCTFSSLDLSQNGFNPSDLSFLG